MFFYSTGPGATTFRIMALTLRNMTLGIMTIDTVCDAERHYVRVIRLNGVTLESLD